MGKLKLGVILQRMAFFEHRKKRKKRMDKLKLGCLFGATYHMYNTDWAI